MNVSVTTSTPSLLEIAYQVTVINTLLANISDLCNDHGMIYLDQSDPQNTQYKCICDRYQLLKNYPPCLKCSNHALDPKNECADVCWPNTYTGDRCNKISCSPGSRATIKNTCACKPRRTGIFCENAACGDYGQPNGFGGCVCLNSSSSIPLNDMCDPPCYTSHGYWNGTVCECYANYSGSNCSLGYCSGRGDWIILEDRCQCNDPAKYVGKFCEFYIGTAWYTWWYLWIALVVIFVLVLSVLGIFIRYRKRAKQQLIIQPAEDPVVVIRKQLEKERNDQIKQHEISRAKMEEKLHGELQQRRSRLPPINLAKNLPDVLIPD